MINPTNTPTVHYTTTARPPRATYASTAAVARDNAAFHAAMQAWRESLGGRVPTSEEILAKMDEMEGSDETGM